MVRVGRHGGKAVDDVHELELTKRRWVALRIKSMLKLCIAICMTLVLIQDIPSSCESAVADPNIYADHSPLNWQQVAALFVLGQQVTCCADGSAVTGDQRHISVVLAETDAY